MADSSFRPADALPAQRRGAGALPLVVLASLAVIGVLGLQTLNCSSTGTLRMRAAEKRQGLAPPTPPQREAADGDMFDWRAYLSHYPDLLRAPTSLAFAEEAARQHYDSVGRGEGRVASPLHLRLRYTAAGGLTNQLLGHLPAFMIARELGAEVVVPPVVSRPGFIRHNKEWRWESAETLLDLDKMQAYWAEQGLVVHKTPDLTAEQREGYPELLRRNEPPTALYGNGGCLTVGMPKPGRDLSTVVRHTQRAALEAAEEQLRSSGAAPECVNMDTGNSFFRVSVSSAQRLALSTLQGFFFNTTLVSLAEEIKQALGGSFNGVHLRLEKDAAGWNGRFKGLEGAVDAYIRGMHNASFTNETTVYAASGLLFNGSTSPEFEQIVKSLQAAGVAKQVAYKEAHIARERLQGLHSEQLALLDILVLAGSNAFVGHPFSTMSVLVDQLRVCAGFPPESNAYMQMPVTENNQRVMDWFVRFAADYRPFPLNDTQVPQAAAAQAATTEAATARAATVQAAAMQAATVEAAAPQAAAAQPAQVPLAQAAHA